MAARPISLPSLTDRRLPRGAGRKAEHLAWLARERFPTPEGWVVPDGMPLETAAAALARLVDPTARYAVRSSADVEDGARTTFAGQFRSLLDVEGHAAVVAAVEAVRASAVAPSARSYAEAAGLDAAAIRMGVVVQRMAMPVVSGVAFSRNPLTGLDEVVVEAIPGRGDALVDAGLTPDRWVVRWGDVTERPEEPRTEEALVAEVARGTRRIAAAYGRPVDLEWVHDGARLWWVQVRPIVGLDEVGVYSCRISREVLPGLIPPLVWTVNVPVVNGAWVDLFTEAIGPNGIDPLRLARPFAYRAYFDMGAIGDLFVLLGMPRDSLELLLGLPAGSERTRFKPTARTWRHLPRMTALALRLLRYEARLRRDLDAFSRAYDPADPTSSPDPAALDDAGLLRHLDERMALARRVSYANIVTPLLMNLYGSLLRRSVDRLGLDGARLDPAAGLPGAWDFDPRHALAELGGLADALPAGDRAALEAEGPGVLERPACAPLREGIDAFLARFGHLADSGNDFSRPRWREAPAHVLAMVLATHPTAAADGLELGTVLARAPRARRPLLRWLHGRAGRFRLLREAVSDLQGRGHARFRDGALELGRRLVERGMLAAPEDVFLLTLEELRASVRGAPDAPADPAALATERRREMAAAAELELPETIIGDDFVPRAPSAVAATLRGVATSRGTYRGRVRVVRSSEGFGRVAPGDVLVVPHSDVAWTPLFGRAGAVIAGSGGMLSHSSIVARERGIPCVVSLPDALRLTDGTVVHVDGFTGIVTVEEVEAA